MGRLKRPCGARFNAAISAFVPLQAAAAGGEHATLCYAADTTTELRCGLWGGGGGGGGLKGAQPKMTPRVWLRGDAPWIGMSRCDEDGGLAAMTESGSLYICR